MSQILGPLRSPARASSLATEARSHRGRRLIRYCQGPGPPHCVGTRFFCGEGACSRLSAQHSQSLWFVADLGAASQPGASKLARHRSSLPQGSAFDQILPRTWATTLRRNEVFCGEGACSRLSAQHSQSLWYVADFGAASQPGASKLARHRSLLPQGAAFDQILPRTWATTLRRSEVFLWRGSSSRLSAQHSQSLWYVADFGAASQPGASKLARHRSSLPQGSAFDQILPRTWATTLRRSEGFLWRGSLLPLERAALTKSVVCRRFRGRFAARREQARSPQKLAPTGVGV